jgi:hypothetical protein
MARNRRVNRISGQALVGRVRIFLREQDRAGRVLATIGCSTDTQTIEYCRAAATRLQPL